MRRWNWWGILALGIASLVITSSHAGSVLFMHQPANLDFDEQLAEFIESLGHTVTFLDTSSQDPDEQIAEAESHDVVYIAESLGSTTTHDGFETYIKEVATPQIWAEAFAWDDAAITGDEPYFDFGNSQRANLDENPTEELQEGQDSLHIINPTHPLAAGFSGKVQVYHDPYSLNWGLIETMGPGAQVIATADEAGEYATLFVYEQGAELEDGTPAAGMRIGFWVGQAGDGPPLYDNLHDNGLQLIEAAINYAMGLVDPGIPGDFNGNDLLDAEDIDLLSANIRAGVHDPVMDLNQDGVLNNSDRTAWVNDVRKTWFGDANLDGEFNSGDFVLVFQAGQYEDAAVGNSNWGTGDWNGDSEFNSGDFVTAFQAGGFEQGPRQAVAAVPEPAVGSLFLAIALFVTARRQTSRR